MVGYEGFADHFLHEIARVRAVVFKQRLNTFQCHPGVIKRKSDVIKVLETHFIRNTEWQ